jgi:DNA-binding transcriptional LysR family regulator
MDLLGTLKVLVRVTETGSFSAVARERNLTQAAVAKQVAQLEETFGVRLFHRTTRKLSLTDDGRTLLELGAAGTRRRRDNRSVSWKTERLAGGPSARGCHWNSQPLPR